MPGSSRRASIKPNVRRRPLIADNPTTSGTRTIELERLRELVASADAANLQARHTRCCQICLSMLRLSTRYVLS